MHIYVLYHICFINLVFNVFKNSFFLSLKVLQVTILECEWKEVVGCVGSGTFKKFEKCCTN